MQNMRPSWFEKYADAILLLLGLASYGFLLFRYMADSPFASVPVVDADYYWKIAVRTAMYGDPLPGQFFSA